MAVCIKHVVIVMCSVSWILLSEASHVSCDVEEMTTISTVAPNGREQDPCEGKLERYFVEIKLRDFKIFRLSQIHVSQS